VIVAVVLLYQEQNPPRLAIDLVQVRRDSGPVALHPLRGRLAALARRALFDVACRLSGYLRALLG
jgi:hypothetical protein